MVANQSAHYAAAFCPYRTSSNSSFLAAVIFGADYSLGVLNPLSSPFEKFEEALEKPWTNSDGKIVSPNLNKIPEAVAVAAKSCMQTYKETAPGATVLNCSSLFVQVSSAANCGEVLSVPKDTFTLEGMWQFSLEQNTCTFRYIWRGTAICLWLQWSGILCAK